MEGVELVMKLEDSFQIQLSDEEASSVRTMADVLELVWKKIKVPRDTQGCLSAHCFYKLRQALIDATGIDRRAVQPSSPMESILPRRHRTKILKTLAKSSGLVMPTLQRPGWMTLSIVIVTLAGAIIAGGLGISSFDRHCRRYDCLCRPNCYRYDSGGIDPAVACVHPER